MTEADLIGKKATIVGIALEGDGPTNSVAHICLDIEDGPRVFVQSRYATSEWRIVEEPRINGFRKD